MKKPKIVIDTNIIFSGLLSNKGSSHRLLQLIPGRKLTLALSVPLVLEYEAVLYRNLDRLRLSKSDIDDFLNYLCSVSEHIKIHYLWRPVLKDPHDDHILEFAVSSNARFIVTFNMRDFKEAANFGIQAIDPDAFINRL